MNTEWKEAMRLFLLAGDDSLMETPLNGEAPSAQEFFDTIRLYMGNAPSEWTGLCHSAYSYHEVEGFGWLVWDTYLYLTIPDYDTYERHEGKWARHETLIEAVQECQHKIWEDTDDREETQRDTDDFLSRQ
jgi:hypothetical protein